MHRFSTVGLVAVLLVAACGMQQPEARVTGTITVRDGPYEGTYPVDAAILDDESTDVGCWIVENGWVVGFSGPRFEGGPIQQLQFGVSRTGEVDAWLVFEFTGPAGTLRMRGDAGSTSLNSEIGEKAGERFHASIDGTTEEGSALAIDLSCSPLTVYPGLEG